MQLDVVVVGSGGGALTAAVTAAAAGLRVLVVEKSEYLGGTTALSGGYAWIPGNALMAASGKPDQREQAEQYIRGVTGDLIRTDLVAAYLDHGPRALEFLHRETKVRFAPSALLDYKSELPGAAKGRTITPLPYDGHELGSMIGLLRPPLRSMTILGGMMLDPIDVYHSLNALRSVSSLWHMAALAARYGRDLLGYRRGMRLTLGNALIARLLRSTLDLGVDIWTRSPVVRLLGAPDAVSGVIVRRNGEDVAVNVRRGVVLAAGGFAHHPALRARYLPFPEQMQTMTVPGNSGDSLLMTMPFGAAADEHLFQSFLGAPISVLRRADGTLDNYMHSAALGRAKPGLIAVGPDGHRFANEAAPYNDLLHSMVQARAVPAWFVFDHAHFRKFGAGWLRPPVWIRTVKPYFDAGYVVCADTIEALSSLLGIPGAALAATIRRYNDMALSGCDLDFHKGDSAFDRASGEASNLPNPNMGPIRRPPFYGLRWQPGNLGTFAGLRIDRHARVLRQDDAAIPGLYACGLDAVSIFSGTYPGGGCSIGPAIVYGFIAGRHLVEAT